MNRSSLILALIAPSFALAQAKVTTPKQFFGHDVGDDYYLSNYKQFTDYWKLLDKESDRMIVQSIGKSEEGREQLMAIVTSPENHKRLKRFQEISKKLCLADGISKDEAAKLAKEGKAVVWIDGGLHANETLGAQQLIETCYQMVSRTDEEATRILNDVIILFVHANPDGMDLISNWYMQESDPKKRNIRVPRLYQKYIGHDNNRDFYAATQSETRNMNRIMYREWFPQIMYNHHQTGPAGTVMFAPPFRDPFNHNIDPLVMSGIDFVGSAMMQRFISRDMPGVTTKTGASYSAWWNGGLRTTAYYHNMIGILTETIGSPTPMRIPFVASRRTPQGNMLYPIEPQEWKFRQSIDYSVQANMAILDLAARYREKFLFDIYAIGQRQIQRARKDTWTDYPSRVEAAKALADLRKPEMRDAKLYVIKSTGVPDPWAGYRFAETLWHNGVKVEVAKTEIKVGDKAYAPGSLLVRASQAFRPHVLDMFEPQDHPNDIPAPGAAPIPPYDSAGYTLAMQMGLEFDRILDDVPVTGELEPFEAPKFQNIWNFTTVSDNWTSACTSNVSYRSAFLLLNKGGEVSYNVPSVGSSVPVMSNKRSDVTKFVSKAPRIALWDRYGGSMESGWTRWIMDQWAIPYKVVFPKELDAGNLKGKFDAIVFVDGGIPATVGEPRAPDTEGIPAEFHSMLGNINRNTIANLKEFLEQGGSVITIGSSTSLAKHLGLPIESHLMKDGKTLVRNEYYIPGSILQVKVDNRQPVAFGMGERADVMFDNSPVFKLTGPSNIKPVAWFDSEKPLRSGWAWGQKYLKDGIAIAEAPYGKGTLYLFGPEILYRGQSYGTFKFFFNALLLSRSEKVGS